MGRLEMCTIVVELVDFDYDETCYEEIKGKVDENEVRGCALSFLSFGVCWLQDEDGLRKEEDTARVKERVGGEEYQRGGKMLAQTEATSRMRPTWVMTAVPVEGLVDVC